MKFLHLFDQLYECRDIDECKQAPCRPNESCLNILGSYKCEPIDYCKTLPCDEGYSCKNQDTSFTCIDIDECQGTSFKFNTKKWKNHK